MKITAEEKHYKKLNIKLQKELNAANERNNELGRNNYELQKEVKELKKQMQLLNEENECLKSKLDLSDDEIKQLVNSSKSINMLSGMVSGYGKLFKMM